MISLAVVALCATTAGAREAPWTLAKQNEQIQLYSRPVDGSKYIEVKAIVTINAPFETVVQELGNGEACSEWRKVCASSTVFKKSAGERYIYMVLDLPWPLSDRDQVIHSRSSFDSEKQLLTVVLQPAPDSYPEQKYIRAISQGSYQLAVLSEKQMQFTWLMHTDLGGDVSAGMVNKRLLATTFDDMTRLVDQAEQASR
jgi:hypothetical protein